MKISIIAIGDELLIGQVTDTNSGDIARHIAPFGWEVNDVQVVGDNAEEIARAINRAFESSQVVLTTGGLGPTKDDITKSVLRDYFGGELVENPEVLENVKEVMRKRNLKLNDLTAAQAIVPTSCRVIQNRVGTAPLMWFESSKGVLVSMPGVPFETREMFTTAVFPQLREHFHTHESVEHRTMIVTGISESLLATRLSDWEESLPSYLHLAYLPKQGIIRLRLDGHHDDSQFLRKEMEHYAEDLVLRVGEHLLYIGDKTPEEILLEVLTHRNLTVATAESCTGGNIAHRLTSVAGASAAMMGGVIAYSNQVKSDVLGVNPADIETHGAVSIEVVEQMALGAARVTGADVAMATSGIAGPTGGTPEKPVGTVCIAVSVRNDVKSAVWHFPGDRARVIDRATTTALIEAIGLVRESDH